MKKARYMQKMNTRMRLANLGVIVTRSVNPVMLASVLLLNGCQSMPADNVGKWEIKTFDGRKLHAVSASSVDQVLINWLIEDYKKAPKDSAYSELTLSRVLRDEEGGRRRYFIFNLEYVDDVNVVYVLDSRNIVLEKFLASPWVR